MENARGTESPAAVPMSSKSPATGPKGGPTSGTKLAQHTPSHRMSGTKFSLLAQNGSIWRVLPARGEFCTECEAESGLAMTAHHAPRAWRGPEGPEGTAGLRGAVWRAPVGQAAAPVGGGGAWPGFETTRRAKLAARTARGRAAAHGRTKQPGPTAPGTPAASQATPQHHTRIQKRPPGTGWAYLSRLWESNPRPIHYE